MEMTPISHVDMHVTGDGAKPQGRDMSSSTTDKEIPAKKLDPSDVVKHEVPIDSTAETVASMLQRADPNMDARTASKLAKILLGREAVPTPQEEKTVGTQLDVSA